METTNLLFVYGTLKKGFGNSVLLEGAPFVGECQAPGVMYRYSPTGHFPCVVEGDLKVNGEVYEVTSDEQWNRLDGLEGHPRWYERKIIDTPFGKAWIYYMPADQVPQGSPLIEEGTW